MTKFLERLKRKLSWV